MSEREEAWYSEGLCFTCTRCGNCCTGFPGTVAVDEQEVAALASRLELEVDEFCARYTRLMPDGLVSLRERANYDCVFYADGHGCLVYDDRPTQCRTWPFWRTNVASAESWANEAQTCPGMNRGKLYTFDEIEERARKTP